MTQGIINPVNNVVLSVEMDEASHGELGGAAGQLPFTVILLVPLISLVKPIGISKKQAIDDGGPRKGIFNTFADLGDPAGY
jgi:hypothetical protein